MTTTADLVAAYTARFSARYLQDHSIGSGLGIWLLLALLAPATEGEDRRRLEAELGTNAADAARRATELLADPHPAVAAAVALWDRPEAVTDDFDAWAASLPRELDRGPMPDQAHANAWTHRHTLGLIRTFPEITPAAAVILASAVAADVSWSDNLRPTPASDLGGPFGASITAAMRARSAHLQLLAHTDAAGTVAVHAVNAASGLRVISVIGLPEVPAADLHRACHQVASLLQFGSSEVAHALDLYELPLGDGHAWTITEATMPGGGRDKTQRFETFLAAWTALGDHDLRDAPGIEQARRIVRAFARPDLPIEFDARQMTFAEFTKTGFRAAALTELPVVLGSSSRPAGCIRTAVVRFNRPYAVLAVALDERTDPSRYPMTAPLGLEAWSGVPVFSAWVGRVDDTPATESELRAASLGERRVRTVQIRR